MNISGESEIFNGTVSIHTERNVSASDTELFEDVDTIFDNQYVRVTLIFLYSVVFCFCFFGNLAVVLVVTLHWKMRSIPKFCLGNLAFANLCVGIFCIYQNLSTFLIDRWLFGPFMCKMYHFINSLSHTASILILVVICVERYLAILHPFRSRQWITKTRLRVAIVTVWIVSALVCSPRLYYINIIYFPVTDSPGGVLRYDMICAPQHNRYNAPLVDTIYFIVLFLLPLLVITVLYAQIGISIWRSSGLSRDQMSNRLKRKSNLTKEDYTSEMCSSGSDSYSNPRIPPKGESFKMEKLSRGSPTRHHRAPQKYSSSSEDAHSSGTRDLKEVITVSLNDTPGSNIQGISTLSPKLSKRKEPKKKLRLNIFGRKKNFHRDKNSVRAQSRFRIKSRSQSSSFEEGLSVSARAPKKSETTVTEMEQLSPSVVDISEPNGIKCGEMETLGIKSSKLPLRKNILRRSKGSAGNRSNMVSNASMKEPCVRPRLAVLRLLIVIVLSFAICNLPFHIRKICMYYLPDYEIGSTFNNVSTPLTFLLMYTNCAINPIIYAFMSKGFRSSLVDLVKCRFRRNFLRNKRTTKSSL